MKKRVVSVFLIALMTIGLFGVEEWVTKSGKGPVVIDDSEVPLAYETDVFGMNNFENWKSGSYTTNGKYVENVARIALKDYVDVTPGTKYLATISDPNMRIVVRLLNSSRRLLKSYELTGGGTFTVNDDCLFAGLTIYYKNSAIASYNDYKVWFENGNIACLNEVQENLDGLDNQEIVQETMVEDKVEFTTDVESEEQVKISKEEENIELNEDFFGMKDFSNWRSGSYTTNGKYVENAERIALKDYCVVTAGQQYIAHISDAKYKIVVREVDGNGRLIKSHTLGDGQGFEVLENGKKIGITIYDTKNQMKSFEMYEDLFANSFQGYLERVNNNVNNSWLSDRLEPAGSSASVVDATAQNVEKVFEENDLSVGSSLKQDLTEKGLRKIMVNMLENGEMGDIDISAYKYNFSKVYLMFEDVIKKEGFVPYSCAYGVTLGTTTNDGIVTAIRLKDMDSDFVKRYEKFKKVIAEVKAEIQPEMKDIEKAIICHDYIVRKTTYSQAVKGYAYASGALVNGYSNCSGYTNALKFLLANEGITSYHISGNNGSHGWLYVILDGEAFFIDATWDDTGARVKGLVDHYFFVRNDEEFKSDTRQKHYQWKSYEVNATSTSTRYTNWFVHDIVGDMYYVDGYWYYWDRNTNTINRARIDGSDMEQLVQGNEHKLVLTGKQGKQIMYTLDGATDVLEIK